MPMTLTEREQWLAKARAYTRDDYARAVPDRLLRALSRAPVVDDRILRSCPRPAYTKEQELTPREIQVIGLVASGFRDREIAERLGVTYESVRAYVKHALAKLGLPNRCALAAAVWAARSQV